MPPIVITDPQGVPQAQILSEYLWDLVEYLSCQRLDVTYTYNAASFIVSFRRMDLAAARQVLDEWVRARTQVAA